MPMDRRLPKTGKWTAKLAEHSNHSYKAAPKTIRIAWNRAK